MASRFPTVLKDENLAMNETAVPTNTMKATKCQKKHSNKQFLRAQKKSVRTRLEASTKSRVVRSKV